jgi:hypothetical protein
MAQAAKAEVTPIPRLTPSEQKLDRTARAAVARMVTKIEQIPHAELAISTLSGEPGDKLSSLTYFVDGRTKPDKHGRTHPGQYIFSIVAPVTPKGRIVADETLSLTIREDVGDFHHASSNYGRLTYMRNPRNDTSEARGIYYKNGVDVVIGAGVAPIDPHAYRINPAQLKAIDGQGARVVDDAFHANSRPMQRLQPAFRQPLTQ